MKKSRPKKDTGSDSDSCNGKIEYNNNTQIDPNHPANLHLSGISGKALLKVAKAKISARPELGKNNLWTQHKYYKSFKTQWPVDDPSCPNNIEYVDVNKISVKDFEKHYVKNKIPCVLLNATSSWGAEKKWTFHRILKKYRNQTMKCGEDDEGNNVKLKIKYYIEYMNTTKDDSPLYIFDANYGEHSKNKRLLEDYTIPEVFQDDIFKYISNKRRPPHRWFVMGPARSGTGIHIDPLGTSAWNALLVGHKRWFICSTEVDPNLVKVNSQESKYQRDEAITWFNIKRPKALKSIPKSSKIIELIQKPNEVVFIPSGWWHTVLNLDNTIAVTQNFAHREHFSVNYHKSARARPKMTSKLVQTLKIQRPELYKMIQSVDLTKSSGQASSSSSDDSSSSSSSSSDSESDETVNRMKRCSGNSSSAVDGKISLRNVSSSPSRKRTKN